MAEKSIYGEPHVPPIVRWHLDAALKALDDHECILPMGSLKFWDASDAFHELNIVGGEWVEVAS